ncbi:predicted protein [Arabidopsis lyrata subsp. lyrata]|uniref:Predicted protein n=1 Tax=Arabidopsis lyrata subsp. lyrata TaxID=81972 RepID=D7L867_ARALL|nr:predicted protein [Arabidopsis lyrata subsp. lyrata]
MLRVFFFFANSSLSSNRREITERRERIRAISDFREERFREERPVSPVWRKNKSSHIRSDMLDSVILDASLMERVKNLAHTTAKTKDTRAPFRNMLLTGPPGTGKSLVATEIARKSLFTTETVYTFISSYLVATEMDLFGYIVTQGIELFNSNSIEQLCINQGSSGGEKLLLDNDGKSSTGVVAMRSGRRRSTVRNERGKQLDLGTGDYGFNGIFVDGGDLLDKVKIGSLPPSQYGSTVAGWQRILDHHLVRLASSRLAGGPVPARICRFGRRLL